MSQVATLGQRLAGRYLVERILGAGAHGRVFAALDTSTGKPVALKECVRGSEGFLRELSALFDLAHPHVLACHNVVIGGPYRYLVTELMDGGSLRAQLSGGAEPVVLLELFRQAVEGVSYAHERRLVHRDLKPENILLCRSGPRVIAKVSDFGISTLARGTSTHSCIGSPAYMAPEQFYDAYDARVDVYALGVILFELLCGSRPFYGSPAKILLAHLESQAIIPSWIPPAFAALIRGALEKSPDDRIPSVAEFQRRLEMAMAEEADQLSGEGWPVSVPGTRQIGLTRHATFVLAGDQVQVLDRRGRCVEQIDGIRRLWATDDFVVFDRADTLEARGRHQSWTLGEVGADARVSLCPGGSVAVVQDGGVRVHERSGVFEIHPRGSGVRDACFVSEEHALHCLREVDSTLQLEGSASTRAIAPGVQRLVGNPERFEMLLVSEEDRATLLDFGGSRPVGMACPEVVCDGENFLGVDERGRLVTLNGRTGRVARTFVDEPLAAVGACSDGAVWGTREGRVVSVRSDIGG